jgi:dTDP-glucose pyrophosphorylase
MAKIAVLNKDDDSFGYLISILNRDHEVATYGLAYPADYKVFAINSDDKGTTFKVQYEGGDSEFTMPFFGDYNVANAAAAITTARSLNISWPSIKKGLINTPIPEGRGNIISNKLGLNLYVDFAHTPNALKQVLTFLKQQAKGRLIAVFGCAGERDVEKRFMMAEISVNLADISVFTAEDPRREDIFDILNLMTEGALKANGKEILPNDYSKIDPNQHVFIKIPERREAIFAAIRKIAQPGDTVVICGKGHEQSMCYEKVEHPWSDKDAVADTLLADMEKTVVVLAGGKGKRMNSESPKVIQKIAGRPMISYSLENLRKAHFGRIIVVVGYKHEIVEEYIRGAVDFALQEEPLGTGHAAKIGLKQITEKSVSDAVIMNGDDSAFYYPETINKILNLHRKKEATVTFVSILAKDPTLYGRIVRDEKGNFEGIVEEKDATKEQKEIKEVNDGLYILNLKWVKDNMDKLKKHPTTGEYYIVDFVNLALKDKKKVEVYTLTSEEEWIGVDTKEKLEIADSEKRERILKNETQQ